MRVCSRCKALLGPRVASCPADGAPGEEVAQLPLGAKLAHYRLDKLLGEGGMGFVYEATHEVLNRRTAIKLLRPELSTHTEVVSRFLQEAKAVNIINHPNIISVYDYGDGSEGCVYFVMEFLEGETLFDLMRKRRPMAAPLLLHVFVQMAKALAAAHDKQIVHRDLKPANVFIVAREDNPYFVKLLDFGIAQLRGEGSVGKLTTAGAIMGTPQFMSPEQVTGKTVDARTDVWALGVMLYRCATGVAPFKGKNFGEVAEQILHHPPMKPSEAAANAGIPPSLDALIASCLERDHAARCASVKDVLDKLHAVERELELDADKILAAVRLDSGAAAEPLPAQENPDTKDSVAGSLPRYQGVQKTVDAPPAPSRAPLIAGAVAIVAVAVAGYALFGRGGKASEPSEPAPKVASHEPPPPATDTIKSKLASGDMAGVRELAERELRESIASGNLQLQGQAVDAIGSVHSANVAPLLYAALKGAPEVRVKAARALGELDAPDAVPKVRAALDDSGEKLRVELAVALYALGDKEALPILKRGLADPGTRLAAAAAIAWVADDKDARKVLADVLDSTPPGRESWLRAAGALAKLGDAKARAALAGELAASDPARAVAAAAVLAKLGDDKARAYLARVAADKEFLRRGDAAVALARLGDATAMTWAAEGLKSTDTGERKLAIDACAMLAKQGGDKHAAEVAALAAEDPDRSVRLVADAALLAM